MKKHRPLKIVLLSICAVLVLATVLFGCFLIFATATTLKVQDKAPASINGSASSAVKTAEPLSILTWNTGYGALDERQDCYWDGGKGVDGESKEVVLENLEAMKGKINELDPDIIFLQELDLDSKRSYRINEYDLFKDAFSENEYSNTFAGNFKAGFIPIPTYNPTGKVDAGISVFSKYKVSDAERIQLPIPFSWPVNLFNLKRCLLVNRLPIDGSDKELVLINLHLEAYSDETGKAKQLAMLMDIMQEEYDKGNYVVAGGDFNQTFSATNLKKYPKKDDWVCPVIEAGNYPSFTFRMDDTCPTCRSLNKTYDNADKDNFQYYMIDGFVVSNNIAINSLKTIDLGFKNTDHNPVMMSITLE